MTVSPPGTTTRARLGPAQIGFARVFWGILACATFVTLVAGMRLAMTTNFYLSPAESAAFAQAGIPTSWYTTYLIGINALWAILLFTVSLLLVWRKSDEWVVYLISVYLLTVMLAGSASWALSVERVAVWHFLQNLISMLGSIAGVIAGLIFPDGRFVPRWTRWLGAASALGMAAGMVYVTVVGRSFSDVVMISAIVLVPVVYAQVYRYRRVSSPPQRQQVKWVVIGLVVSVSTTLLSISGVLTASWLGTASTQGGYFLFMPGLAGRLLDLVVTTLQTLGYLALPVALAFAILRYRLWDIDFIINRSLVYGLLGVLLAAIFGLSLLVISQVFQASEGGTLAAVAISAAIFGAVFQPARRRLQRFVDQRFYNIQVNYHKPSEPLPQPSEMTQILKRTQFGDYQNLELIGRGGMAEVYRSLHPTLHCPIAIKLLPAPLAAEAGFRQRFQREGQIVAGLQHPNIVRVYDYGAENDTYYIVMEFLSGRDLAHALHQHGRLSLDEAHPVLEQIAAALDYAHGLGLVHRDIKPSNVMLENDSGRAVLMDFGLAKIVGGQTALTHTEMLGTLGYIAPEQIQDTAQVDHRADIYALGVMVYQMLAGELPFTQQNPGALLMAHLLQPPPDIRSLAPDLPGQAASALQQAMHKHPAERFATAGEFIQALG